jgi:hypothetical protein
MAGARRFWKLECWLLARQFKIAVHRFAERPPVKRDVKFYDQLRDAAASPDFARFLDVARASLAESQNHLLDAIDRGLSGRS